MAKVTVEIEGLFRLEKQLKLVEKRALEAVPAVVYGESLALMEVANRDGMVPKFSGRLAATAYVTEPRQNGSTTNCEVGYGAPYAPAVHAQNDWLRRSVALAAGTMHLRMHHALWLAISRGTTVGLLRGVGFPTRPQDPGDTLLGSYQRRWGFTKKQRLRMSRLRKAGHLHFVPRPKQRKGK